MRLIVPERDGRRGTNERPANWLELLTRNYLFKIFKRKIWYKKNNAKKNSAKLSLQISFSKSALGHLPFSVKIQWKETGEITFHQYRESC